MQLTEAPANLVLRFMTLTPNPYFDTKRLKHHPLISVGSLTKMIQCPCAGLHQIVYPLIKGVQIAEHPLQLYLLPFMRTQLLSR